MMIRQLQRRGRRGAMVPFVAVCFALGMFGFIALAIDLGMMVIARNQAQNAADAAAMAAARTLNGDVTTANNSAQASVNGLSAAQLNYILNQQVTSGQVNVTIGDYYYNSGLQAFQIQPTGLGVSGDNYTLAQATVTFQGNTTFGQLFNVSSFNTTALATAAHRPRDVVIVQDFSTSMRFDSYFGMNSSGSGAPRQQSMNPDTNYPAFGHFSGAPANALSFTTNVSVSTGETAGQCNYTVSTQDGPPIVYDYYSDTVPFGNTQQIWGPSGGSGQWSARSSSLATNPGGDAPSKINLNTGATYAQTVKDIVNGVTRNVSWELDGYSGVMGNLHNQTDYSTVQFKGYTQGPGFWGNSFFIWPPDPRVPWDPLYWGNGATGQANIQAMVKQFLTDFGLNPTAGSAAEGIYKSNASLGSNNWPGSAASTWANATALSGYLQARCGLAPGQASQTYEKIMRLFNRGQPAGPTNGTFAGDWRARFFFANDGVTPLRDNTALFGTNGNLKVPRSSSTNNNYRINYAAILNWIGQQNAQEPAGPLFPNQMRRGGVLYYTAIPSTINLPPASDNEKFWQMYIDHTLGVHYNGGSDSSSNLVYQIALDSSNAYVGYRADYAWGVNLTAVPPWGTWTAFVPSNPYMSYTDNPYRSTTKYWFGPLTMVDCISNNMIGPNWQAGNVHEAPTFQTKLGIQAALNDIQLNHPNDNVASVFFSTPGNYDYARMPLGKNYKGLINVQWFSPKIINTNAEITPFSNSGNDINDIPRAQGGTCFAFPLMQAHNQLSNNSSLVNYTANAAAGTAGGLGRLGATKLIIFETDGMINQIVNSLPALNAGTSGNSYWHCRVADANNPGTIESGVSSSFNFPSAPGTPLTNSYPRKVTPGAGASGQAETVLMQIVDDVSNSGLSTQRKPVLVQCIAFGILFDPANNNPYGPQSLQLLHNFEVLGSVQNQSNTPTPNSIDPNKIIYGSFSTRISKLQAAFQTIMQDAVQVTLISSNNQHTAP